MTRLGRLFLGQMRQPHRFFHSCQLARNKPMEVVPENTENDQFSEMLDDRTNALFRSLGIDSSRFQEQSDHLQKSAKVEGNVSPTTDSKDPTANASKAKEKVKRVQSSSLTTRTAKSGIYCDTQGVYCDLYDGGLTAGQSEVVMRTVQELMNDLVAACKDRAVPVSAAANEAYLFDAASSEVRNEISNSRQGQATSYRSGLARLQRDVEILEHSATEMTNLLKSDLDIEVHERKNSARAEENIVQLKIQDLNNKIGTRLNSELKSEIENLRWQITRRSLTAIAVIAGSLIWLTQSNTSKNTAKTQELQKHTQGQPVPVHILAPSLASGEDSFENVAVSVEDLNNVSGLNSSLSEAKNGKNHDGSEESSSTDTKSSPESESDNEKTQ